MSATPSESLEPPRVGATLQSLRQAQGLSLDELSRRAGVSKSMLSQIERAQANPSVAVVWRLAQALHDDLGQYLAGIRAQACLLPLVADQPVVVAQTVPQIKNYAAGIT